MEFEVCWRRSLHQAINPKAFLVCGDNLYLTERSSKLLKIDIVTGEVVWVVDVPNTWGWLSLLNDKLYYISREGLFTVINKKTGLVIDQGLLKSFYPGYLIPSSEVLISGGWRGYSNLTGYDANNHEIIWEKNTRSSELQNFSVPHLLNTKLLISVNHSLRKIEIINIEDGVTRNDIILPKGLDCPDLDKSFQLVNGKVTFLSKDGFIFELSDDYTKLYSEKINENKIVTSLPYFIKNKIIYEDNKGNYCLYDRAADKVLWRQPIAHNLQVAVHACEIVDDVYLLGGSLGQLIVMSKEERFDANIKSEMRITTKIFRVGDLILYGNKSEVVALRYY